MRKEEVELPSVCTSKNGLKDQLHEYPIEILRFIRIALKDIVDIGTQETCVLESLIGEIIKGRLKKDRVFNFILNAAVKVVRKTRKGSQEALSPEIIKSLGDKKILGEIENGYQPREVKVKEFLGTFGFKLNSKADYSSVIENKDNLSNAKALEIAIGKTQQREGAERSSFLGFVKQHFIEMLDEGGSRFILMFIKSIEGVKNRKESEYSDVLNILEDENYKAYEKYINIADSKEFKGSPNVPGLIVGLKKFPEAVQVLRGVDGGIEALKGSYYPKGLLEGVHKYKDAFHFIARTTIEIAHFGEVSDFLGLLGFLQKHGINVENLEDRLKEI